MKLLLIFFASLGMMAAQSRTVNISWTASTTTGVTGYTISTAASAAGAFTFRGCTGTVPAQTCVAGSTATTNTFADSQPVGTTVFYQIAAVAGACTNSTPVTSACGTGSPILVSTTVPQQPTVSAVVVAVP